MFPLAGFVCMTPDRYQHTELFMRYWNSSDDAFTTNNIKGLFHTVPIGVYIYILPWTYYEYMCNRLTGQELLDIWNTINCTYGYKWCTNGKFGCDDGQNDCYIPVDIIESPDPRFSGCDKSMLVNSIMVYKEWLVQLNKLDRDSRENERSIVLFSLRQNYAITEIFRIYQSIAECCREQDLRNTGVTSLIMSIGAWILILLFIMFIIRLCVVGSK